MPPARAVRSRTITNENDENDAATTRVTRAKAAALTHDDVPTKKPLQTKRSVTGQPLRKRAALGDVSNVTKSEVVEGKKPLESKKPVAKTGLVSKAAQPQGVQKAVGRTNSRAALGTKDTNKKTLNSSSKRPASGSGALGAQPKKRQTSRSSTNLSVREEEIVEEPVKKTEKEELVKEIETEVIQERQTVEVEEVFPDDEVKDLDAEDIEDPLMVAEYVVEIFEYLHKLEEETAPNPDYMEHQDELEWKMRGILVDWLIEVHTRFRLLPETLFLAVNIIDRFLSTKVVQLDRLQLVGVTAMFIASKYEEVLSPQVSNFRRVADDGFTEQEILSAERFILGALSYDLSYPNPMNFLRRISKADDYDIHTRTLGKYLIEVGLLDHRFISYPPSLVAAASMYLARMILGRGEWHPTIAHYAGYTEEQIEPVFKLLVDYLARPVVHLAFFKKYASKKFLKVSLLTREWAKANADSLGINTKEPLYPGAES